MTRKKFKWIIVAVVVAGVAAFLVFQFTGGREYSSNLEALRAEFNRDRGRPRLIVLLSPT